MNDRNLNELLAWYANGTLDDRERAEVEAWLADNPQAQLDLAEYEFLRDSVAEEGVEEAPFPLEANFDRLLSRIDAEEQAANETLERRAAPGLLERLGGWLQWNLTPGFARVAIVSQFALVLALGALLLIPGQPEEGYEVLSGPGPAAAVAGVQADIGFSPSLSLAEFQQLLRDHQAQILAGPSGIGVYRILLPEAEADRLLASLQNHRGVTYLQRIEP